MSIKHSAARHVRTALLSAATVGAGLAGLLGVGGVAHASTAHAAHAGHVRPDGWVVVTTCTGVSGKITYSPGLRTSKVKAETAVLTGTTSGCSNIFTGAMSGTGTITATLSGNASANAENFSGTFTINWPAGSGFNPSNGNLTISEANGVETVSGAVSSGFETGSPVQMQYVISGQKGKGTAGHLITSQSYVNTQALTLSQNEG